MFLNGYSVRIPEGDEKAHGYVHLRHGQTYSLVLGNKSSCRCNTTVRIDGKEVGTWRMERGQTITLERPVNEARLFTFYKADSTEGASVGGGVDRHDQGLLSVEFLPEDTSQPSAILMAMPEPQSHSYRGAAVFSNSIGGGITRGLSAGVTGLSGQSSQRFGIAEHMPLDHNARQVINLRLVCEGVPVANNPSPLRPVTEQMTPVPPAVG